MPARTSLSGRSPDCKCSLNIWFWLTPFGPNPSIVAVLGCVERVWGGHPNTVCSAEHRRHKRKWPFRGATWMSLLSSGAGMPRMDSPAYDERRRVSAGRNTRLPFSFAYFFWASKRNRLVAFAGKRKRALMVKGYEINYRILSNHWIMRSCRRAPRLTNQH